MEHDKLGTAKEWLLPTPLATDALSSAPADVHPVVAAILARRGLFDAGFEAFFNPSLDQLHDPLGMRGMADAVRVLDEAMRAGRKITIYGDYDVDGTTASAALVSYIRERTGDVDSASYYIPMRLSGYGIRSDALDEIKARYNPELLISVDCGIKSRAEVEYAKRLGMSVIITDHHLPEPGKTPLGIVIDPHQDEDEYPFKHLAGVGVAYKLISAHFGRQPAGNLDLVAMGTVADVMPLTNENRVITAYGLERLASTRRVGLAALIDTLNMKSERRANLTAHDIGFRIGPKINALGRVGMDPNLVVELFTTKDEERGRILAQELHEANERRKSRTDLLAEQAIAMVNPDDRFIVLEMDTDIGVTGLVAGRVAQEFNKPVIILSHNGAGSGRSIEGAPLLTGMQTGILDEFMGVLCDGAKCAMLPPSARRSMAPRASRRPSHPTCALMPSVAWRRLTRTCSPRCCASNRRARAMSQFTCWLRASRWSANALSAPMARTTRPCSAMRAWAREPLGRLSGGARATVLACSASAWTSFSRPSGMITARACNCPSTTCAPLLPDSLRLATRLALRKSCCLKPYAVYSKGTQVRPAASLDHA